MKVEYMEQIQLYILEALNHPIDNGCLICLYYQIGGYLCEHQLPIDTLKLLERKLQCQYGIVIGFTKRNFLFMMQFYRMYFKRNLNYLKWIAWHQHLHLLKKRKWMEKKLQLVKHNPYRFIVCHKKCSSFIQIDYMLTELQKLQKKMLSDPSFACYNRKGGR